jgi:translation initiation factor IF-3
LSRPFTRNQPQQPTHRVNGKIRAREVRVIGQDGQQVGIIDLPAALTLARNQGVDLVEIASAAVPPVCRLVDYGKFKYELAKKERDSKKHQHTNVVKEVQLSARIDPHDLGIKLDHAVEFLCEDMKLKVTLRFRGREMAHTQIGIQVVTKFLEDLEPWGHSDSPPKLIGRSINVMISPHPKHKRAKNPKETGDTPSAHVTAENHAIIVTPNQARAAQASKVSGPVRIATDAASRPASFGQNPFSELSVPSTPPVPPTPPTP